MTKKRFAYALAAAFAASASGTSAMPLNSPICKVPTTGKASWYGPGFYGNKTANGELFTRATVGTAAHKTLPYDSIVEITDLHTKKKLKLRINDRGPHKPGRIIDLPHDSAEVFGLPDGRGITDVTLKVLRCGPA